MPFYFTIKSCFTNKRCFITSELLPDVTLLLLTMVMTTVRLMRGSATESRLLPVTVTSVPPLSIIRIHVRKTGEVVLYNFSSETARDGSNNTLPEMSSL